MKQLEGILKFLPDPREFPSEEALLEHISQVFVRLCLPVNRKHPYPIPA